MLCRLDAMKEAGVLMTLVDSDRRLVVFSNGVELPIIGFYGDLNEPVDDPEEASWFEFGDASFGYGTAGVDWDTIKWIH